MLLVNDDIGMTIRDTYTYVNTKRCRCFHIPILKGNVDILLKKSINQRLNKKHLSLKLTGDFSCNPHINLFPELIQTKIKFAHLHILCSYRGNSSLDWSDRATQHLSQRKRFFASKNNSIM